jgi:RNA polymerase sigma-70 factor (ECF subfamily)
MGDPPRVSERVPRLHTLSDEELMSRYAGGDEAAFEIILSRYTRPLFGFLCKYPGRVDRAEDVFQDVFYEVIRGRRSYRPRYRFAAWLFRIGRNRAVDRLRRNGVRKTESLDHPANPREHEGETQVAKIVTGDPDPESEAQSLELGKALEAALASLPADQREVFWLKERSGLSLGEIAEITGVSQNTVKSRLRYALEKLRATLVQQGFEP